MPSAGTARLAGTADVGCWKSEIFATVVTLDNDAGKGVGAGEHFVGRIQVAIFDNQTANDGTADALTTIPQFFQWKHCESEFCANFRQHGYRPLAAASHCEVGADNEAAQRKDVHELFGEIHRADASQFEVECYGDDEIRTGLFQ